MIDGPHTFGFSPLAPCISLTSTLASARLVWSVIESMNAATLALVGLVLLSAIRRLLDFCWRTPHYLRDYCIFNYCIFNGTKMACVVPFRLAVIVRALLFTELLEPPHEITKLDAATRIEIRRNRAAPRRRPKASTTPHTAGMLHQKMTLCRRSETLRAGTVTETAMLWRVCANPSASSIEKVLVARLQEVPLGPPLHCRVPSGPWGSPGPASTQTLNEAVLPGDTPTRVTAGSKTKAKSLAATFTPVPVNGTICGLPVAVSVLIN